MSCVGSCLWHAMLYSKRKRAVLLKWRDLRASVPKVLVLSEPWRTAEGAALLSPVTWWPEDTLPCGCLQSTSILLLVLAKKKANGEDWRVKITWFNWNNSIFTPTKHQHKHVTAVTGQKALPHGPDYGLGCWSYMKLTFPEWNPWMRGISPAPNFC